MMAINLRDYSRTAAQRGWGAGWPSCSGAAGRTAVVTADRSGARIAVHQRIARLVDLLIDWTEHADGGGYLLKPGQCGGYNCRPIAGTSSPSNHSWGLALDLNWLDNPYTSTGRHTIPWPVIRRWNRYGFASGADYEGALKDWMHLEFMGGAVDADAMTALALRELTSPLPQAPAPRRPLEDQTMRIETPHPTDWAAPKTDWPASWISFGLDPAGGWGGAGIVKVTVSAPGGWIHEAKWWRRPGTGVGQPNRSHEPVSIAPIPGGNERFQGYQLELAIPDRADELELLVAAPGGAHFAAYYQH